MTSFTPSMSNNNPAQWTGGKPGGSRTPDVILRKDPDKPPTPDNIEKVIEIKLLPDPMRKEQVIGSP